LFASCALKLLRRGSEIARGGNPALGLMYRQLAVVLVGEDEILAQCEEERFSFVYVPRFELAPAGPVRAGFTRC
jgi:hypothetical protein